jgi:ribose transport system substrate-binding protein
MRKSLVAAVMTASALALASCAMPADDPNFGASGGEVGIDEELASANAADQAALDEAMIAPTSIGVDAPLTSAPAADLNFVSLTDGSAYEGVFEASLAEAAAVLGWTVESITVDAADPFAIATAFDEAVATAPAGIHVTGAMVDALAESLPAAQTAGIPVVCTGCSSATEIPGITDTSINGTEQNTFWGNVIASYVVDNQYDGEDAGVQVFSMPGGAAADFNLEFSTSLLDQCRNCSSTESFVDPLMVDMTDPASIASFVSSEMSTALGSWALLDSGALSETVAESLVDDPLLLAPVVVMGRGASAADIANLQALEAITPAPEASPGAEASPADEAATDELATDDGFGEEDPFALGRTPEEAAALQAWIAIPQPVMAWRVVDQFARIIAGDALSTGPLPSELLTAANADDAVVDETGNYIGIADYQDQFKALWGVQ